MTTDYARFGRQIALPEMGAQGQDAIARSGVRAPDELLHLARQLWRAAGGDDAAIARELPALTLAADDDAVRACQSLGVAAWCCVEAARETLGLGEPTALPTALIERLTPPRGAPP